MKRVLAAILTCLAVANAAPCQDETMNIKLTQVHRNAPLTIPLSLEPKLAKFNEVGIDIITGGDTIKTFGQMTKPGITTESIKPQKAGLVRRDLHISVPDEPALELIVRFSSPAPHPDHFAWAKTEQNHIDLNFTTPGGNRPVLRYMNRRYDASSADAREKSYKVFHHLYDPTGKRLVTNGGQTDDNITDPKKLLFPHHRGIMYGFNKCYYGPDLKTQADTWHCPTPNAKKTTPTAHVAHEKVLSSEAGPVLGRHRVQLGWFGGSDKPFAQEERELTVYNMKGGTLVEFASRLKTTGGKIKVDGDPQHAGFQFRAANDVAEKTKKLTYYLHPDGAKGEMGKERNWPQDKTLVDLPWYAMSFVLDNQRYSVVYLNHPQNPKETRFSERDYARFGGYFERVITEETPLVVNYRLLLQPGEVTKEQATCWRSGGVREHCGEMTTCETVLTSFPKVQKSRDTPAFRETTHLIMKDQHQLIKRMTHWRTFLEKSCADHGHLQSSDARYVDCFVPLSRR